MTDEHEGDRRQVQMFITAMAGMMAEAAQRRAERVRIAAAESRDRAQVIQAQMDVERSSAQAVWQPTLTSDWWVTATVDDIQRAYQAAAEWADVDPNAARAADAIEQGYAASDGRHPRVDEQHATDMAAPNVNDWDTRSRREQAAQSLSEAAAQEGVAADIAYEAIEAHMLADVSQAEPSQSAVSDLARAASPQRVMTQRAQERRPQRSR